MLYESKIKLIGKAGKFPEHTNERVYMQPFFIADGLPDELSRWQDLVTSMLVGVDTKEECYLMIDQKHVEAKSYHRRPGVHIDGYWYAGAHGGHTSTGGSGHRSGGTHTDYGQAARRRPVRKAPTKKADNWGASKFDYPEAIILATNEYGCNGFEGLFEGPIGNMGDCSNVKSDISAVEMHAGRVYAGNVTMLHESIPMAYECDRTVVRINTPGWSP